MPFLRARCVAACLFVLFSALSAGAVMDWSPSAEQLARKIVAVTGPGAVALEVSNRSSLSQSDLQTIRGQLTTALASLGIRFVNAESAAATVQVFLSESLSSYVWIGEIRQGTNDSAVVMVSQPRPDVPAASAEGPGMTIRKVPLWSQPEPILDAAVMEGNPAQLLVLGPDYVTLYKWQANRWEPEQSLAINHVRPWPRDLRGRLLLRRDHLFDVYLPGVYCQSTAGAPLSMNCRQSDDPWPVASDLLPLNAFFAPARNFFTGVLATRVGTQSTVPAFYSAAPLPRPNYTLWLLAALDGQIHLIDGMNDQTARFIWGSNLASVRSPCGSGWQVLASVAGTGTRDSVRAFELSDREPVVVSQPVEFDGGITALWSDSQASSAIAVSRSAGTGGYEAFRLTVTCGQ